MAPHKVIITEMLAMAIRRGIEGIESEIRSVEAEQEKGKTGGAVTDIIETAVTELHQCADILRGTLARYEDSKK
jgi:hypothetical protein